MFFDYFFHDKCIHYHRDTELENTLWGWVDADWDGDREDEGQLGGGGTTTTTSQRQEYR